MGIFVDISKRKSLCCLILACHPCTEKEDFGWPSKIYSRIVAQPAAGWPKLVSPSQGLFLCVSRGLFGGRVGAAATCCSNRPSV